MEEVTIIYVRRTGTRERTVTLLTDREPEELLAAFRAFQLELQAAGRTDYVRPLRVASDEA